MAKKRCAVCWNHEEFCACSGRDNVVQFPVREDTAEYWGSGVGDESATISLEDLKRLFAEQMGDDEP